MFLNLELQGLGPSPGGAAPFSAAGPSALLRSGHESAEERSFLPYEVQSGSKNDLEEAKLLKLCNYIM